MNGARETITAMLQMRKKRPNLYKDSKDAVRWRPRSLPSFTLNSGNIQRCQFYTDESASFSLCVWV